MATDLSKRMQELAKRPRTRLHALKRKVAIRGLSIVDRRSHGAKALFAWRDELLSAIGGEAEASPQKKALVEMVVRTRLYVDHIDSYLMELPTLIIRRKKALMPIVRERQQLVDSLAKLLAQLGLERQAKPVEDLDAFLERKAREKEEAGINEIEKPDADDH